MNQQQIQEKISTLTEGVYASIVTSKGTLLAELYYKKAPMTVANFVGLAEGNLEYNDINIHEPFYDGIIFHRVIPNFMIQTGDPLGVGTGGPGYSFPDEIVVELKHDQKGVLSMANSGPNTNGSQFFITQTPTTHLDGKHSVFGKIIAGLEIIDSIAAVDTGSNDKPVLDINIIKINIIRNGQAAQEFRGKNLFSDHVRSVTEAQKQQEEVRKQLFKQIIKEKYPQAIATNSGLYYSEMQKSNARQVLAGDTVILHYNGSILEQAGDIGAKFDSSYDRNEPISVVSGRQGLIPGFEEGLLMAKKGQKLKLFIPYFLAYGEKGIGPIPPFSNLVFDIEIIDIK